MGVQCFCLNNQLPTESFIIQQKFMSRPKFSLNLSDSTLQRRSSKEKKRTEKISRWMMLSKQIQAFFF